MIVSFNGPGILVLIWIGATSLRAPVAGLRDAHVGKTPGEHTIHRRAEVVDVGAFVNDFFTRLFGGHKIGGPLDAVLLLAAHPGGAEVDQFDLAGLRQHDVGRLEVAVKDPPTVHVRQRRGDLVEDQDELVHRGPFDLVKRLAIDVLHQKLDARDLEPRALDPQVVDFGDGRMVQLLRNLVLDACLVDVDVVVGVLPLHHLEGITLAAGRLVADLQDRAACPGAEGAHDPVFHRTEFGSGRHVSHASPRSNAAEGFRGRRCVVSARFFEEATPLCHVGSNDMKLSQHRARSNPSGPRKVFRGPIGPGRKPCCWRGR